MKKFIALLAALAAVIAMFGCLTASAESIGMANPNRYDVGFEEMLQVTGIELKAPADAKEISYNIIGAESESPMAEVTFTLDGKAYCFRAQPTAAISLHDDPDMDASAAEILNVLSEDTLEAANISGIYTEWTAVGTNVVSYRDAILMQDGKTALLSWMDPVPGILYNLSVKANLNIAQQDAFVDLAEELFVPMQADSEE